VWGCLSEHAGTAGTSVAGIPLGAPLLAYIKALHISTLLIWCAGLFYLPGLYAAHPQVDSHHDFRRLRIMTRFAFVAVISPAAVVAVVSGTALVFIAQVEGGWMAAKLGVVSLMVLFHLYCGRLLARLGAEPGFRPAGVHLLLLVPPLVLIPLVFWLVLGKPL